jgi:hypothetical protein
MAAHWYTPKAKTNKVKRETNLPLYLLIHRKVMGRQGWGETEHRALIVIGTFVSWVKVDLEGRWQTNDQPLVAFLMEIVSFYGK